MSEHAREHLRLVRQTRLGRPRKAPHTLRVHKVCISLSREEFARVYNNMRDANGRNLSRWAREQMLGPTPAP